MDYKSSITGFHNPVKHSGLTPEHFLKNYVASLQSKRFKKNGYQYTKLADFINTNWEDQIKFVKRLFYPTTARATQGLTNNCRSVK